jgi:hypothetical protein
LFHAAICDDAENSDILPRQARDSQPLRGSSLTGKKSDHTAFSSVSSVVWMSFPRYGKQIVDIRISPNITKSWATLMAVSCKKTHHLFLSAFPMFVPSLSWSK